MNISGLMKIVLVLLSVIVVLIMAGPRVKIDETINPVPLPQNLDQFLIDRESQFTDIIPGAEKKIIWAGAPGTRTEVALVYIHGFSATRQETAPLADSVARHVGANLYYTRMVGHGRTGDAMLAGNVNAWLNGTFAAFEIGKRLGEKVIMIGVSTGATAATWLAAQSDSDALAVCILISPNFFPADKTATILTWPWGQQIAELMIGKERHWEGENSEHDRYWTNRYPTAALLPMMGLVKLVASKDLGEIKTPMLVIASPQDQVVSFAATQKTFASFGSQAKKLIPYEKSQDPFQHILAGDILSPDTTREVADMIIGFILENI